MAFRLRRSLLLSSSLLRNRSFSAIPSSSSPLLKPSPLSPPARRDSSNPQLPTHFRIQSFSFRSSSASSSSSRFNDRDDGKISPDTILFEGCDYNHWLITMDFPKDPKPTPEEMVETYVQTLAKVVGSVEEAKKRMYACSTTTYNGFQAVMTEEMSEKFRGLPGVVFILPDSYIDPVNKEYGGDKYINGTIIPRPPPVQYGGRQGRFDDRNRRPRDRNTSYDRPSSMQGDGRNYAPQQNYGQPGQDGRGYGPPPSRDFNPSMERGNASYDRQGSMQGDGRNYVPQQNYGQTGQGGYGPPASRDFNPNMERGNFGQGERRDYGQAGGRDYNQGQQGNYVPQGDRRDYVPPEHAGFRGNSYQDAGPSGNVDYRQGSGTDQGRY